MKVRTGMGMFPGGLRFVDPRTGRKWMDAYTFLGDRVKQIIEHRASNPTVYVLPQDAAFLDMQNVAAEVAEQNCTRINNDKNWCFDGTEAMAKNVNISKATPPLPEQKCPKCNAPLVPRYCPTCGGHKIIGYTCPACNHRIDV